jgi:hypothetical protein
MCLKPMASTPGKHSPPHGQVRRFWRLKFGRGQIDFCASLYVKAQGYYNLPHVFYLYLIHRHIFCIPFGKNAVETRYQFMWKARS